MLPNNITWLGSGKKSNTQDTFYTWTIKSQLYSFQIQVTMQPVCLKDSLGSNQAIVRWYDVRSDACWPYMNRSRVQHECAHPWLNCRVAWSHLYCFYNTIKPPNTVQSSWFAFIKPLRHGFKFADMKRSIWSTTGIQNAGLDWQHQMAERGRLKFWVAAHVSVFVYFC